MENDDILVDGKVDITNEEDEIIKILEGEDETKDM